MTPIDDVNHIPIAPFRVKHAHLLEAVTPRTPVKTNEVIGRKVDVVVDALANADLGAVAGHAAGFGAAWCGERADPAVGGVFHDGGAFINLVGILDMFSLVREDREWYSCGR